MSNIQTDHGIVAEQSRLLHFPVSFFNRDGVKRSNTGLESGWTTDTCGYSIHVDVVYITGDGCHHIVLCRETFALPIGCNG